MFWVLFYFYVVCFVFNNIFVERVLNQGIWKVKFVFYVI